MTDGPTLLLDKTVSTTTRGTKRTVISAMITRLSSRETSQLSFCKQKHNLTTSCANGLYCDGPTLKCLRQKAEGSTCDGANKE